MRKEKLKDIGRGNMMALIRNGEMQKCLDEHMIRGATLSKIADLMELTRIYHQDKDGKYEISVKDSQYSKKRYLLYVDEKTYSKLLPYIPQKDGSVNMAIRNNQRMFLNDLRKVICYMSKEYDRWTRHDVESLERMKELEGNLVDVESTVPVNMRRVRQIKLAMLRVTRDRDARAEKFDNKFDAILEKYGDLDKIMADIQRAHVTSRQQDQNGAQDKPEFA